MKRLISSAEAIQKLATHAPSAWCKRLLLSLMMDGSLRVYAKAGHIVGRIPASCLLDDNNLNPVDGQAFWDAVSEFWGPGAPKEKDVEDGFKFPVVGYRWYESDTYDTEICYGYFVYADYLDWEAGSIIINSIFPAEVDIYLFPGDDYLFNQGGRLAQPRFSWMEYRVDLSGISFETASIEMLLALERPQLSDGRRQGRPTKWDWAGAMMAVVRLANSPDGIGQERGEQSRVEDVISQWFIANVGDQPHASQIRDYAARVMAALAEK